MKSIQTSGIPFEINDIYIMGDFNFFPPSKRRSWHRRQVFLTQIIESFRVLSLSSRTSHRVKTIN